MDKKADTNRFKCCVTKENYSSRFPMATIRSIDTTCIYDHSMNDDICQGLKIDVEFLDGVPEGRFSRRFNWFCAKILALFRAQRVPARSTFFQTNMAKVLLYLFPSKKVQWKISKWCENRIKKTKFGSTTYVRYSGCALRPSKSFAKTIYKEFEGYEMPIPEGYDAMLRAAYGDFMQYPPVEHQKPATDNLVFYDLDHSYVDYKGKYYCIDK